jgi:hypothetical protein
MSDSNFTQSDLFSQADALQQQDSQASGMEETIEFQVCEMYKTLKNFRMVAKAIGLNKDVARKILENGGMMKRKEKPPVSRRKRRLEPIQTNFAVRGLCVCCGEKSVDGYSRCQKHLESSWRRRSSTATKCGNCGKPTMKDRSYCETCFVVCREKQDRKKKERLEKGLCYECDNPIDRPGKKICKACCTRSTERTRKQKQDRTDAGMCVMCGKKPPLEHSRYCEFCYFKIASSQHFATVAEASGLQKLFHDANGQCAYTGRQLTLGLDAQLDHIVAITRGGANSVSNMQWIHRDANQMKWNYSEEEFLALVRDIARNRLGMKEPQ